MPLLARLKNCKRLFTVSRKHKKPLQRPKPSMRMVIAVLILVAISAAVVIAYLRGRNDDGRARNDNDSTSLSEESTQKSSTTDVNAMTAGEKKKKISLDGGNKILSADTNSVSPGVQTANISPQRLATAINNLFGQAGRHHIVRRGETLINILRERAAVEWPEKLTREQRRRVVDLFVSMNPGFSGNPLALKEGAKIFLPTPLEIAEALIDGARAETKPGSERDRELAAAEVLVGLSGQQVAEDVRSLVNADAMRQLNHDAEELIKPHSCASKYTRSLGPDSAKRREEVPTEGRESKP